MSSLDSESSPEVSIETHTYEPSVLRSHVSSTSEVDWIVRDVRERVKSLDAGGPQSKLISSGSGEDNGVNELASEAGD